MLHRAARNAYSWWWASHIRTKQSKWLEQSLQDMEEKVEYILQIINEEGDSFAVRAEMYYKKRPECFRGYRALADRYDLLSKDLQNANRTIAAVYPERVQLSMEDDDDDVEISSKALPTPFQEATKPPKALPAPPPVYISPKNASFRQKNFKAPTRLMSKKGLLKFGVTDAAAAASISKSGLTKSEAIEEIDRLQKGILGLQTEKEFAKISYENGHQRCVDIDKQVTDMQVRVSCLQDEFGIERVIEDDEAQMLMAATALNSCQEKLCSLQDKQGQSVDDANVEAKRVNEVRTKFETMIEQLTNKERNEEESMDRSEEKMQELGLVKVSLKEHLQVNGDTSLTVSELAEKIDELVETVINLESSVSSQNALVKRLRSESDELHAKLKSLEGDKESLIEGSDSKSNKIRELEGKLFRLQNCNKSVIDQVKNLQNLFKKGGGCDDNELVSKDQNVVSTGQENALHVDPNDPSGNLTLDVDAKPDDSVQNLESSQQVNAISCVGDEENELDTDAGDEVVSVKDAEAEKGLTKDAILQSEKCNSHLDDISSGNRDNDNPEKGLEENANEKPLSHDPVISIHNNADDEGNAVQVHDHDIKRTDNEEEHIVESNMNNQLNDLQMRASDTSTEKGQRKTRV